MSQNDVADDIHRHIVGKHRELWLYIIEKYRKEASSPIVGLGDLVVSPLIELSQWGYPIIYVSNTYQRKVGAKKLFALQAGTMDKAYVLDFLKDCPKGQIITFIGIAEHIEEYRMMLWLYMLTRRAREVVFVVPIDRDWNRLLSDKYDTLITKYNSGDYYLISISRKYDESKKLGRSMEKAGEDPKAEGKAKILREKQIKNKRRTKKS